MELSPLLIKRGLKTKVLASEIFYYSLLNSTNETAKELASKGAKEGALIVAEEQRRGKGRRERVWLSEGGKNILASIIFRPQLEAGQVFYLTMIASLSIAKAIKEVSGLEARIKWPNDVYLNDKKVCGILTEFSFQKEKINYAIVGIGINVNSDPSIYPEIRSRATSILKETGKEISRVELFKLLLSHMEEGYGFLQKGKLAEIREEWEGLSLLKGKMVKVVSNGEVEKGFYKGIDENGALIIQDLKGERKRIVSGDASLELGDEDG